MKFEIVGKNGFAPSKRVVGYAEKKLMKVVNFFGPDIILEVRVLLKEYKDHYKVEVTIPAKNTILRAEVADVDMFAAIDKTVDKLVGQIRRQKDRLKTNLEKDGIKEVYNRDFDLEYLEKEVLAAQLVKNKKVELKPMTPDEAITQMELLGHSFFVFLDSKTRATNVVYRREDGDYAVIETKINK